MDEISDTFEKFWNSLGSKPNSAVRFFDRQDYYTVHFEDAELLARSYYKSQEILKYFTRGSVSSPYINISKTNSTGVFKYLLISNQYKVEIYNNYNKQNSENPWMLYFVATPGNIEKYQDILFNDAEISSSNTLLALNIKKVDDNYRVYLGFCDRDNGVLMLGAFDECFSDIEQLSNLSSAIFQMNCRECLIPGNDSRPELQAVQKTCENSGLLVSPVKKSLFSLESVSEACMAKLLSNSSPEILSKLLRREKDSLSCLGALVTHLELGTDPAYSQFFSLENFELSRFMCIGDASSRSLHLLPGPNTIAKHDSLYGLLNSCRTNGGMLLLAQWIKQPLMDPRAINERLDIVASLIEDTGMRVGLFEYHLRRVGDLHRITKRLHRGTATLQDMYKMYNGLAQTKEIGQLLENHKGPHRHVIQSEFGVVIQEILDSTDNFMQMFQSFFDFEAVKNHEYQIRCDVDENLTECFREMQFLVSTMTEEATKVAGRLGIEYGKQLKFESSQLVGHYMRVSRKDENVLRNKNYITVIETQKDGTKFHTSAMASMNESYSQLRKDYSEYEKSIVDEIMKITRDYISPLHRLSTVLSKLDVLCSLAVTVCTAPADYVRPTLIDSEDERGRVIKLRKCRHPLVEMQCNVSYIPNDVTFDGSRTFHIITGPNMGGKSTYIRSIGLVCVMAQIGSFVPCNSAEISVSDRVMTRIGTGDCQLTGVSTFMAEMLDISWIIKTATPKSLILIDELGRGTSTFDGFGLAWAISEHIARDLRAFGMFATHFHELTELEQTQSNVVNLHVSAAGVGDDAADLVFLYQVEEGPSLRSYGVEVAEASGLPEHVAAAARRKLAEYESRTTWAGGDNGAADKQQKVEKTRDAMKKFCNIDLASLDDMSSVVADLRAGLL